MKRIIYLLVAAIGLLVGCTPDEETWVQAGFTTDKESYEIGDLITLTNTSTGGECPDCSLQMGIYG